MIRQGHSPELHIVVRRNADFRADLKVSLTLAKLGARPGENRFIVFARAQGRLIGYGAEFSRRDIAHINKTPPAIARAILPPAGDGQITPTTVATPGVANRQVIPAIRQKVDFRIARNGGIEDSHLLLLLNHLP